MRKYIRSFALGLAIGMVVCLLVRKADADVLGPTFTGTKLFITAHYAGSDTLYTDNDYTAIIAAGEVLRVCNDKEDPRHYEMVIAEENAAWIRLTGAWAGDTHTDGSTYWYHNGYQFMVGSADGTGYDYYVDGSGNAVYSGNVTAAGTLSALQPVEVLDANDILTASQSNLFSLYRPLTAKRTATLPTASAGLVFDFMVADADSLLITAAAGDSLVTSAGVAWKTTSSTGGALRVVAVDAVRWIMFTSLGTWTSY